MLLAGGEQRCRLSHALKAQTFGGTFWVSPAPAGARAVPRVAPPRSLIPCTPVPSLSGALSHGHFHGRLIPERMLRRHVLQADPSCHLFSLCPLSGAHLAGCWRRAAGWCWGEELQPAVVAHGGPLEQQFCPGARQCLSSFRAKPGVQRTDGHYTHMYFFKVLPLCAQYSERYHPESAPEHRLPLSGEKRRSLPYCAWL